MATAFDEIYETGSWGVGSGPGSDPHFTIEYRAFIQRFMALNGIRSVVDIGCGDWQFSRYINFANADYTGLDVVRSVVDANTRSYARPGVRFDLMPEDVSTVPGGDLLIIKDVLQHLPNSDIFDLLHHVVPRFRYALITNSFEKIDTARNYDISGHGDFRCLDLSTSPYEVTGAYVFEYWALPWERIRTFLITNAVSSGPAGL